MSNLKFTIVTIAYNAEREIEETMQSVLHQRYRPLEYVIVDGGSKDRTNEIIKRVLGQIENDIEIRYISEPDQGISDAFNRGIGLATGDVIGLINSGDCLLPASLEKLAKAFKENDNVDIFYGNTLCIDKQYQLKYLRRIPSDFDIKRIKYDGLLFTHQSAFVKKRVYDDYGTYDTSFKYVMDTELFAKFSDHGVSFMFLNETLVSMLAGGISSKPSLALVKENIRVSERYGGYSKTKIYYKWIKGLPRYFAVKLVKHFPLIWYLIIGKKRAV